MIALQISSEAEVFSKFEPLFMSSDEYTFPEFRPMLAHYTSIVTLESILKNEEIWFSNPLLMNDWEELRFGMEEGKRQFFENSELNKVLNDEKLEVLHSMFNYYYDEFNFKHALDVYVFCLSLHDIKNTDGKLSMWRGYGARGSGAAVVFDTSKLSNLPNSALRIGAVEYLSTEHRKRRLAEILNNFAKILKSNEIPKDLLGLASWAIFQRIKLFSLYSKHDGFSEENEWRVVYIKELDKANSFGSMLGYSVTDSGIAPKLKLSFKKKQLDETAVSMTEMIAQIILGPSMSTPFAKASFERMLENNNLSELKNRVVTSTIPFRP